MLSSRLLVSSTNEDIVVKEPQNPTATNKEYLASKFKDNAATENKPKTKLPRTFTANTLTGNPPM